MKQILTVYTGGTIGCAPQDGQRKLNAAIANSAIAANFASSESVFAKLADTLFVDSKFSPATLSENMTPRKWEALIAHLRSFDLSAFCGVIVLHGTDTLAYTAALLSLVFANTPVPILLVSGNRPPTDPESNANVNFRTAVDAIMAGISPNIYVPYRNADGTVWLHRGATLMQCANGSEDFVNASPRNAVAVTEMEKTVNYFKAPSPVANGITVSKLTDAVTLLHPYTGLCYRGVSLDAKRAVVHGTYHSGTVCVERNAPHEPISPYSVVWLLERCRQAEIPVFLAPCTLDDSQYSSAFDAVKNGATPLSMTTEAAYVKALVGASTGLAGQDLIAFMQAEYNYEMI